MTTNVYRRLLELLPADPLLIASVVSINADGTSTVEFPGGSRMNVRGTTVAVGLPAFIRSGAIERQAPALTAVTVDI